MARITMIGSTGMVGQPVAKQLAEDGYEVTALVRDVNAANLKLLSGVFPVRGDVSDVESLQAPLADTDAIVIIMPLSTEEPGAFNAERDGTLNLIAALPNRDTRIVKLSEIGAGSDPSFRDLEAKASAEEAIRQSGHSHVILRPTWFMEAWIDQLRAGLNFLSIGSGQRLIHWVALEDMARWISAAITSNAATNRTFTVQGQDALTISQAAHKLADAVGTKVVALPVDGIKPPGAPEGLVQTLAELFRYYDRTHEVFESQDLWQTLGKPQITFDTFVARMASSLSEANRNMGQ